MTLSRDVLRLLEDAYGLAGPRIIPLERGSMNANFRVHQGDQSYHLKCYNPALYQVDDVCEALEIQERVGRAAIPVAAIVRNVEGSLLTEAGGVFCALSTFVQG